MKGGREKQVPRGARDDTGDVEKAHEAGTMAEAFYACVGFFAALEGAAPLIEIRGFHPTS